MERMLNARKKAVEVSSTRPSVGVGVGGTVDEPSLGGVGVRVGGVVEEPSLGGVGVGVGGAVEEPSLGGVGVGVAGVVEEPEQSPAPTDSPSGRFEQSYATVPLLSTASTHMLQLWH